MFAERLRGHDQELPGYAAKFTSMATRLVAYDGDIVCPPTVPDDDIDRLLTDGSPHDGTTIMQTGLPNRCHENTARLWESGSVTAVGTGYALSDDGMWRQHSWGLRDGTVIETTEPRVRYWGLTLVGDDADRFAVDNG